MRVLGLDVGEKTIGVAVSDPLGWTAQALEVIRRGGKKKDTAHLLRLVREQEVGKIVVGLPRNLNGTYGRRADETMKFCKAIGEALGIPIVTWDERLTTVAAERALLEADLSRARRKEVIDKTAAVLILQGYLDSQRRGEQPE